MQYPGLPPNVFPIFPARLTLTFNGNVKISRLQIPIAPAFALTEYKVQRATFKFAIFDLRRKKKVNEAGTTIQSKNAKNDDEWTQKRFCSMYVQLSRLETLVGVKLLEKIDFEYIDYKPDTALLQATTIFDQLSQRTLSAWQTRFDLRRQ